MTGINPKRPRRLDESPLARDLLVVAVVMVLGTLVMIRAHRSLFGSTDA